ncbi:reverse transcriptase [Gossypium australe]|uniref:Reverse transcriptase n=1 Tax=Gossypium australe TaxID=47621 RepID=A0A5B6VZV7_9ROSI|nr:reverse transcriptase [Gossypium australe]
MQPNCLFARVMKSKYFSRGDFMSARLGSYPSFTWRSILGARHILEEGLSWRVGNGEEINIWNDAWILEPGNGRIQCQAIDIRFTKVADLVDKESTTWKQDIISSLFVEEQSRRILAIPLVSSRPPDTLIWRGDNTGCYTVKSGFKRIITAENPSLQNEDSANFFTKLWALKIPSKICIFIWKLVHNFLPTKVNLNMRQLTASTICPVCQGGVETVHHLFRDCSFTKQILQGIDVADSEDNRGPTWKDWLVKEFNIQNTKTCEIKAIVYWDIWYNRNKIHLCDMLAFMKAYHAEISVLRELPTQTTSVHNERWLHPEGNVIKINFDASFNQVTKRSISGIIARNKDGLVMAACTCPWDNIPDLTTAEARACLQAIDMAEGMGFHEICVEGDSLTVINKINSEMEDRSTISSLIKKIRGRFPKFRVLSFRHIPREANKVAHEMACEGKKYAEPRYWIEEASPSVERLVAQDIRERVGRD